MQSLALADLPCLCLHYVPLLGRVECHNDINDNEDDDDDDDNHRRHTQSPSNYEERLIAA